MKFKNIIINEKKTKNESLSDEDTLLYKTLLQTLINSLNFNMIQNNHISVHHLKDTTGKNFYSQSIVFPLKDNYNESSIDAYIYNMQLGVKSIKFTEEKNDMTKKDTSFLDGDNDFIFLYFLQTPIGFAYARSSKPSITVTDLIWITTLPINEKQVRKLDANLININNLLCMDVLNKVGITENLKKDMIEQLTFLDSQFQLHKKKIAKEFEKEEVDNEKIRKAWIYN